MMPSTYRESTRAVSAIGSPRPSCTSRGDRNKASPPSWYVPTSNETRVRVDDFMKIIARDFPASGFFLYLPARIFSASTNKCSISFAERSGICRKSRCGFSDVGVKLRVIGACELRERSRRFVAWQYRGMRHADEGWG